MPEPDVPRRATRRESGNANVDLGETHTIRGTNRTNLQVFDQYIRRRSAADEYSPKLRYWKARKGEFLLGYPAEFTLSHDEAVELHAVLSQGLAVAADGQVGEFLTLPLSPIAGAGQSTDPDTVARAALPLLAGEGVLAALAGIPDARSLVVGIQTAARVVELQSAVQELTSMLDGGVADEHSYQDWCEEFWWAFGPVYVARDEVRTIAIGDNVDLLMERTSCGLRDVLELKRPDMAVLNYDSSHKSYYWSADTTKALGQCHRYLDALHEGAARGLRDNPQVVAYHPRASVVIGRSQDWEAEKKHQLHGLNSRLHGMTVMTYDDMLGQAKQMVEVLQLKIQESSE